MQRTRFVSTQWLKLNTNPSYLEGKKDCCNLLNTEFCWLANVYRRKNTNEQRFFCSFFYGFEPIFSNWAIKILRLCSQHTKFKTKGCYSIKARRR